MSGTSTASLASALTTALAPKGSMQRMPFALESYQHPSLPLSAKRLLNFFAEQEPGDARTAAALISTPGLTIDAVYGSGPILAMNDDEPGRLYIASGTNFFRQSALVAGSTTENLGPIGSPATDTLPSYAQMVTIAVGPTAVVVVVPPNAFTCGHTGPLNQIGGSFPGASTVAYLDGYFVFTSYENSSQFFTSALLDPTTYDALAFAFSDGLTNVIRRVVAHRGEIWLMGDSGSEVWYDSGDVDFPFRRQAGGVIDYGVSTPKSIARAELSVFWVGTDAVVYQSNGYVAERISTHAIEAFLQANDCTAVVSGLTHTQSGHTFYSFTLGTRTLVYDTATRLWHDRSSSRDGSGRWLPNVSALRGGVQLLGDSASANVYYIDPTSGLENGVAVRRQTTLPPIYAGTHRAFMNRVEIEMETGGVGPGATILLEWSDDGGWTFTGLRQLDAGSFPARTMRVVATRLGSFRQRVLRVTMQGHATLYAVDADLTQPLLGG